MKSEYPHWIKRRFRTPKAMERSNEWWQKQKKDNSTKKHPRPRRSGSISAGQPSLRTDYPPRFFAEDARRRERWPDINLPLFKTQKEAKAQLAGFTGVSVSEIEAALCSGYRFWLIPKRGTTEKRIIMAPKPPLKKVQRAILERLYTCPVRISDNTFGCVPGRNTKQNTDFHRINYLFDQREQGKHFSETLNLDIKDAFPSVKPKEVRRALLQLGILGELNTLIVHLCTEMNGLPQGAPTSGYVLNLVLQDLIQALTDECQKFSCIVSIYVDDITVTGYNPIPKNLRNRLIKLIKNHGFRVAQRKTRKYQAGEIPHITGLTIVQDQIKIKRKVVEGHRMRIRDITRDLQSERLHPKMADARIRGICAYSIGILGKIHPRLQEPLEHYNQIRARFGGKG